MSFRIVRGLHRAAYQFEFSKYTNSRSCSNKPSPPGRYSREAVRQNVKGLIFTRYFDYLTNYDKVLEKKFPSAMHVYRVFFEGVRLFYKDMKQYLKINRILLSSPEGPRVLTRKELELYVQLPKDMIKVAPALIVSALPFAGYVVFPIAFMFPRIFLTSHFWTIQQKAEFNQFYLKKRLLNNRKVFRCVQAKLDMIKNDSLYGKWKHILGLLGSGLHPTVDEILHVKDIFTRAPYKFGSLSSKHIKYLCHMHGLRGGLFKRSRLIEHAYIVHNMDLAISREGDVHNMPPDALKHACYIRGLHPTNLSNESMIDWLRQWVKVSLEIKADHICLFLHLPILIGYNHPNNWKIIYL